MQCAEARRLLDQGVIPGSTRGRNPQLGFHLASCAACRAYRERGDQQLLAELVAQPSPATAPQRVQAANLHEKSVQLPVVVPTVPSKAPVPHVRRRRVWLLALSGVVVVVLLLGGWYFGLPLYRAAQNYSVMYQSPPAVITGNAGGNADDGIVAAQAFSTATATSVPPTDTATATPRPSSTPLPTATPTIAPTSTPAPTPTPALPEARAMTILLLGIDARTGEGLNARSDAMMLVRVDPQTGDVALLSMPRDMWVTIPGFGQTRVNAAFYYGERAQPNGGGLALARQTIGDAFGVQIDHAVVVDFNGFRSLIDALGGITVDVPKEIYDGQYPTDDYGYTVAHFLAGSQQMDGDRALMYARTRHPDSDFERIKRQQLVLIGIANKLKERGTFQNLHEADLLTQALTPFVKTDMPPDVVLSLLWGLREIDTANVRRYTVDGSLLWETNVNGAYALVPQDGVLAALGQKLLYPPAP